MKTKFKPDPDNYAKLSQPHESPEIANQKISEFIEKVSQARKECGISDLLIVIRDSAVYKDGQVGEFFVCSQSGNQLYGEALGAYAYSKMQSERREFINKIAGGNE